MLLSSEVFCRTCRSSCRQGVNAFRSGCSVVLAAADTQSRLSLWQTWPPCDRHSRFRADLVAAVITPNFVGEAVACRRSEGLGMAAIDAKPTSSLQSVVIDGQSRPDSRWQSSLSVPFVHLVAVSRAATLVAEPPSLDRPHHCRSRLSASQLRHHKTLNVNTQDG